MSLKMVHHGHIRLLKKASDLGYVIVALVSDDEIFKSKGFYPILCFEDRKEIALALKYVEEIAKINVKKKILKTPRVGDHIWYISDTSKFKKHYPRWKQRYNTKKIIEELIEHQK